MKKIIIILCVFLICISCADSKVINIDNKKVEVKPYGWMNKNSRKIPGVKYDVYCGNVVLNILLSKTVIVPVLLTGLELFEPVGYEEDIE